MDCRAQMEVNVYTPFVVPVFKTKCDFYKEFDDSEYTHQDVITLHQDEKLSPLVNHVFEMARHICDDVFTVRKDIYELELTSMWINKCEFGVSHRPHMHPNAYLSGVYFLNGDGYDFPPFNACAPWEVQIQPTIREHNPFNSNIWEYPTIAGDCYMWPSWMVHYVDSNMNKEMKQRKTISWNISLNGYFQTLGTNDNGMTQVPIREQTARPTSQKMS